MAEPIRLLIVDDQPRALSSLRALVSTWAWAGEMREASGGREAVALVEEFQPDVVLMDVRMPEIDGLQATRQIKARWPWIKIILLSMYGEHCEDAVAAGADAFVGKGEASDKLLDLLSAWLPGEKRDV